MDKIKLYRGIGADTKEELKRYIKDFWDKTQKAQTHGGGGNLGNGIYFTTNKTEAIAYSKANDYKTWKYSHVFEIEVDPKDFLPTSKIDYNKMLEIDNEYKQLNEIIQDPYKGETYYSAWIKAQDRALEKYVKLEGKKGVFDGQVFNIQDKTVFTEVKATLKSATSKVVKKKNTSNYWQNRAVNRMTEAEKYSETQLKKVYGIYNEANKDIDKMIANVFANYSKSTGLDKQTLHTLLSKADTDKFWKTLEGKELKQYVKSNYKARITRLEKLKGDLYIKSKEIAQKETSIDTNIFENVLKNGYNNTIYDTSKGLGRDISFNQLDNRTIEQVLNYKWSGNNYSTRIWKNTDLLANKLQNILSRGIITGVSYDKMSREIRDAFNCSKYYADRLIRTEANHFHNEAEYQAYKEMGVEEYIFVATLDSRTSKVCQNLDGKIIKMSEKAEGVNYPPLHPNCRSTVMAYFGEEFMPKRRMANGEIIEYTTYRNYEKSNIANIEGLVGKDNILEIKNNVMYTNYGINYDLKSLKWLSKKMQEPIIKQLSSLTDKYPNVTPKEGLTIIDGIDKTKPNTKGYATRDNKKIYISSKFAGNRGKYIKGLENEIKDGFKMPILRSNYDKYTITHEYGHIVQNAILQNNPNINYHKAKYDIINIAKKQSKKDIEEIMKSMSKYGKSSDAEFFAEAFTMAELGGKNNIIGKAMKEYLKGVI